MRAFVACVACVMLECAGATSSSTPDEDAKLVRVVVLARHGNRAPNVQVQELCVPFYKTVFPSFGVPLAALSIVGMAENWENGFYLKKKYLGSILKEGPYVPDGTATFFAERMSRNIIATYVVGQAMYPDGTGYDGYLKSKPNLIPIATTQQEVDELMNCARDGPCRDAYKEDFAAWSVDHEALIYESNRELFERISKACNYEVKPGIVYQGKNKYLAWAVKAIADAFFFGMNEGLDVTMNGSLTMEDILAFKRISKEMVSGTRFSKPRQLTYWVSNFLPHLFKLAEHDAGDASWYDKNFHLFLNHRELIYAIAHILEIPIQFPGSTPDTLVAGCSLTFEIYEKADGQAFMKFLWWGPTQPDTPSKRTALLMDDSLLGLYKGGNEVPAAPRGCTPGELCPLAHIKEIFYNFTAQTGSYQEICGIERPQNLVAVHGEQNLVAVDGERDMRTTVRRRGDASRLTWFALLTGGVFTAFVLWNRTTQKRKKSDYARLA